jgi:hypothetical protein
MKGIVPPDPETNVSQECYGVVYMPGRTKKRFPSNCVQLVESLDEAISLADSEKKLFAARLVGPSKSSEGQYIFYLLEWIE